MDTDKLVCYNAICLVISIIIVIFANYSMTKHFNTRLDKIEQTLKGDK